MAMHIGLSGSSQADVILGAVTSPTSVAAASPRKPLRTRLTELLVKHRWAVVVPVILPLSRAYDVYWQLRNVYYRELTSAAGRHAARVTSVAQQIHRWNEAGRPGLLHTSRKSWQSVAVRAIEYKKGSKSGIDVDLHDILVGRSRAQGAEGGAAREHRADHAQARAAELDHPRGTRARRSDGGRPVPRLRHRVLLAQVRSVCRHGAVGRAGAGRWQRGAREPE